jgi:hypothetical protein
LAVPTRQLPTAINKRIARQQTCTYGHQQTHLQDNYLRPSTNALHFSHRTNKHLRNLRLFTRKPLHSNFDHEFTYTQDTSQRTRRNRQRNIIWFNPPFSKSVNGNIGREFLSLIDKHFPLQHKLHKIFNRNTLKISYSCTNYVKSIITKHNPHIIRNSQSQNIRKLTTVTATTKTLAHYRINV